MYPAVLLTYFIPAAVILLASLALIVQVSLPYNKTGRASVLCSFILVSSATCKAQTFGCGFCSRQNILNTFLLNFNNNNECS